MNLNLKLIALAVCFAMAFSSDAQAQRRGGGAAGKGGTAGGRGGASAGGNRGGGGRSGGVRPTGGARQQPGGGRTAGSPDFHQSMGQIRGGAGNQRTANRFGDANPGRPADPNNLNNLANNNNIANNDHHAFSAGWYASNPNAWRYNNPNVNAYAMATTPNMMNYWGYPGGGTNTVVVPGGTTAPAGTAPAQESQPAQQPAQNEQASGDSNTGDWMPIGVFNLAPAGKSEVTRAVQLATNKKGEIKGNQIDLLSDATAEVHGRYDASSKSLQWTVGNSNKVLFSAKAESFNKPGQPIPVDAHYADGTNAQWVMIPVENPDADEKSADSE